MANVYRSPMRAQVDGLVDEWAVPSEIIRTIKTTSQQGQIDEVDDTLSTDELIWIQPARGNSDIIQSNLNDKTTHLAFQKWSGLPLQARDRITPSGSDQEYDVINAYVEESHRYAEVALVVKQ